MIRPVGFLFLAPRTLCLSTTLTYPSENWSLRYLRVVLSHKLSSRIVKSPQRILPFSYAASQLPLRIDQSSYSSRHYPWPTAAPRGYLQRAPKINWSHPKTTSSTAPPSILADLLATMPVIHLLRQVLSRVQCDGLWKLPDYGLSSKTHQRFQT